MLDSNIKIWMVILSNGRIKTSSNIPYPTCKIIWLLVFNLNIFELFRPQLRKRCAISHQWLFKPYPLIVIEPASMFIQGTPLFVLDISHTKISNYTWKGWFFIIHTFKNNQSPTKETKLETRDDIQSNYRSWVWKNRSQKACWVYCSWWSNSKEKPSKPSLAPHSKCKEHISGISPAAYVSH